ncbi:NAD(P)-dependent alcohol dehydrogenase [Ralstonia pseudosolanacearum]|uniref:NAD(P)-dependent alcohol dehydrogenase n=1 Tax=Ralstonia pseudosolanacearum TaxID=1310165 RepID=UPI0026774B6B|nr:NAD(P)-dependent alcohol dehydrogenase [Ralstonia pseudosolanacearum]MDO3564229.1 NAD(P)-dependent alcohol dehydrogenase [Ralstonia pseudosolanacearum]MDO3574187.1 NAD(P)-dependent alcohol dehydrogenase [Ralstonia pseudosolanacearum]MDO3606693.1 NAD(P)-dependent alcohol dehydrogenase [Ralstonia pseudosolanacearum]MDO3613016.1 NAD(P)-dependent alcohol dehydrogenase [Ralstonia pseudosolanacearum]MDO3618379.1 NAD(P)-dependent alcohol dehydrogenase [Ralstonia pseudosolanacearum]
MNASGYAASSATDALAPFAFERRQPRPDDVVIDVLFCGVCHTDLHLARNHGGFTTYPIVPGHEIIGRVRQVGDKVSRFKAGDMVGVGCMVDSCQHGQPCLKGWEQDCSEGPTFTYNGIDRHDGTVTYGGYSDSIVVGDKFVLSIPNGLDPAGAAPLLCAGITTWSPLHRWNVGPGSKVAVIGLGGLGHMALKLAKALGADVSLFTRSPGKEEDAFRLGADHVVLSNDPAQMAAVAGRFDVIIDTVPYDHDINPYMPTLALEGVLVLVGYLGPLGTPVNAGGVVRGRRAISGSFIGGVPETQQMLDFCGQHGIVSDVEIIAIQQINQAYERLLKSDVKYRFVIDMASLKTSGAPA